MLFILVDDVLLDFYLLEDVGMNEIVYGLLIVVFKEVVINIVFVVEWVGLYVSYVDFVCFVVLCAVVYFVEDIEVVVDIGVNGMTIVIYIDGIL